MKKQTSNSFTQLGKEETTGLTQQVKETVATLTNHAQTRSFGALDLWNIHRQRKVLAGRRLFV
ncbi:MAG TPA: hypothetical protein VKH37_09945 [Ferruginibacter sp.]|nr:hypothetical protein [Ferruginibacter sp.]